MGAFKIVFWITLYLKLQHSGLGLLMHSALLCVDICNVINTHDGNVLICNLWRYSLTILEEHWVITDTTHTIYMFAEALFK